MTGTMVGSFRIVEKIGEGGMGAVYRAVDTMLEREVAVKALRPELARDPRLVERFRSEAIVLARLRHPAIAAVHAFLKQDDEYFLVLEYVPGETLDRVIRREGPLDWPRAARIALLALEGIEDAHRHGIVHRDLKPENLMVTPEGGVKVMDFGIARVVGSARLTRTGQTVGTLEYMAPEQVRGEETDARTDVYSMGAVLYEMLTGSVPFRAESDFELMMAQIERAPVPARERVPGIPAALDAAVTRALAKDPEKRFASARELGEALEACRSGEAVPPTRIAVPAAPAPRSAFRPWYLPAGAAALVGVVALFWALVPKGEAPAPPPPAAPVVEYVPPAAPPPSLPAPEPPRREAPPPKPKPKPAPVAIVPEPAPPPPVEAAPEPAPPPAERTAEEILGGMAEGYPDLERLASGVASQAGELPDLLEDFLADAERWEPQGADREMHVRFGELGVAATRLRDDLREVARRQGLDRDAGFWKRVGGKIRKIRSENRATQTPEADLGRLRADVNAMRATMGSIETLWPQVAPGEEVSAAWKQVRDGVGKIGARVE